MINLQIHEVVNVSWLPPRHEGAKQYEADEPRILLVKTLTGDQLITFFFARRMEAVPVPVNGSNDPTNPGAEAA